MQRRVTWIRCRVLALAVAALGVVAISGTALAGHQTSGVKSYTGCLVSGDGVMIKIKEGNAPRSACTGGQVEAHFSGGDITKISVGSGLSTVPADGANGEVRILLDASHTLPQGCDDGEVAKWETSVDPDRWICRDDNDTTYTAGTGLDLSQAGAFEIEPAYRVPGKSCALSAQFVRGFSTSGDLQCAAPAVGAGVQGFSAHVDDVAVAGQTTVISKNMPAGTYLLFATVELENQDADSLSLGFCSIPGYSSEGYRLEEDGDPGDTESISMTSAIAHAGGAVVLMCEEADADVDVKGANLSAIKVDSLG